MNLIGVDRLIAKVEDEAFADPVMGRADASLQVLTEDAAAQAIDDIDRSGGGGDLLALRNGAVEQRDVHAQRAEAVAELACRGVGRSRRGQRAGDAVGAQRPKKNPDVLNVVAATSGGDAAHVDLVRGGVETGIDVETGLPAAQVRGVMVAEADVVHVLRVGENPEELDGMRAPSGDVAGQLLHDQQGALATAQRDGLGHLGAGIVDGCGDALYRLVADQVADIRDHP